MKDGKSRRRRARRLSARGSQDPDRRADQGLRSQGAPQALQARQDHPARRPLFLVRGRCGRRGGQAVRPRDAVRRPLSRGLHHRLGRRRPGRPSRRPTATSSSHNKRATHPLTLLRIIGSSASAHVGIEYGIKGPTFATCSACSTATHAIGVGRDYIRNGLVDVAIAGASESVINYGTMKAWQAMHVLSPEGCFPFAKKRNGTVLGEGAGILVLESLEHAKARGATILAELVGYGMTSDSKDMVNPDIEGPREAMQHGAGRMPSCSPRTSTTSTPTARRRRSTTSTRPTPSRRCSATHAYKLAISSTKSMHGHPLGAGGGIEAVACIKAMQERLGAADDRPRRAGSESATSTTCPTSGRDMKVTLCHVELVRVRRPQRRAGVRTAAGLTEADSLIAAADAAAGSHARSRGRRSRNVAASRSRWFS